MVASCYRYPYNNHRTSKIFNALHSAILFTLVNLYYVLDSYLQNYYSIATITVIVLFFRWREISPGSWRGIIGNKIWTLSQDDSHLLYQIHGSLSVKKVKDTCSKEPKRKKYAKDYSKPYASKVNQKHSNNIVAANRFGGDDADYINEEKAEAILRDYFQLHIPLKELYAAWSEADENFSAVSAQFPGVRILNQDPVENVFSFICSSNNNIQRSGLLFSLQYR